MSGYSKIPIAPHSIFPPATGGSSGYFKGANKDRQRRADYNALRRSGDWAALDVPAIVLWIDDEPDPDDVCQY